MNASSNRSGASRRWAGLSVLVAALILVICSFVFLPKIMKSDDMEQAGGSGDELQVASREVAEHMEKPEEEEEGYERITDGEYAKRAASSPDQARIGQRFARRPASGTRGAPAGLDWQRIGPRPFTDEYWSGNDDASGRVTALLVDPDDPDIVYAAGAQGGVWKTTNAGVTWTPMSDYLSSLASGALAFDPTDSDVIYYGTGEQHFSGDSFYGDGLFPLGRRRGHLDQDRH